jgi:hypothetical protein
MSVQPEDTFYAFKQVADKVYNHQKHNDKPRYGSEQRYIVPACAYKQLMQYGDEYTDRCDLEYQVYVQRYPSFYMISSATNKPDNMPAAL